MRIPYGVKCNINGELCKVIRIDVECQQVYLKKDDEHGGTYSIVRGDIIKPYLRPMSSMTEEEQKEYDVFCCKPYLGIDETTASNFVDWLNKKMFDYRGLIPRGLAIEAPENMYKKD